MTSSSALAFLPEVRSDPTKALNQPQEGAVLPLAGGPSGQYLGKEQPKSHRLGGEICHVDHVTPTLQLKGKQTQLTISLTLPQHHLHIPTVLERQFCL